MVSIDIGRNFRLYGTEMQKWYEYSWGWFPKFSKGMLVQIHTAQEQTSDYFFKLSSLPSNNHKLLQVLDSILPHEFGLWCLTFWLEHTLTDFQFYFFLRLSIPISFTS